MAISETARGAVVPGSALIKGTAVMGGTDFIRKKYGDEAHRRIVDALPQPAREVLSGAVLAGGWYPTQVVVEYMAEAERQLGTADLALSREMGTYTAFEALSTVFRLILKLTSPLGVVKRAAGMWSHYHNSGRIEIVERDRSTVMLMLYEFAVPSALLCSRWCGYFQRLAEATGARSASVRHDRCRAHGAPVCEFEISWSPRD